MRKQELLRILRRRKSWGRWGETDARGATNLITPAQRVAAAGLVRSGRVVSLARDLEWRPTPAALPSEHQLRLEDRGEGLKVSLDRLALEPHGFAVTHLDALSHVWHEEDGTWGGVPEEQAFSPHGAQHADVAAWADGIVTRGVLLDIPLLRGADHVTVGNPISATELAEAERAHGVTARPGDALVIYGGRDRWERANPDYTKDLPRPGLDASCVSFIRDRDVSALCWDFHEQSPTGAGLPLTVHLVLAYFGVPLIDNADLGPLAAACRAEGRNEFLFVVAPLRAPGATGSPVNPLALL